MSINNNRYDEIRKKISTLRFNPSQEEDPEEINIYKRINLIEENVVNKISFLNKKINTIKDDFLSMSYAFEARNKKRNLDLLPNQIQSMNFKINFESKLALNKNENTENIKLRFNILENHLKKVNLDIKKEKRIFGLNELINKMKKESKKNLENVDKKIKEEKEETSEILKNLGNEMNKQIEVMKNEIKEEESKREDNMNLLSNNLKEIENQINEEFEKNRKIREEFEENIFNLLEKTCIRLTKLAKGEY